MPTESLEFVKPRAMVGVKELQRRRKEGGVAGIVEEQFLESSISYKTASNSAYDGQRLNAFFGDEWFKVPSYKMDILKQIDNIRNVLSLENEKKIIGKGIICSTVEEIKNGETVEKARKFWDSSDHYNRGPDGRTMSGFVRVFRGYQYNSPIDEYGRPKVDEAAKFRDERIAKLQAGGDTKALQSLYRKQPATIHDALVTDEEDCVLYPHMCRAQLKALSLGENIYGCREDLIAVEGNLVWENGNIGDNVIFLPQKGGKWHISQRPIYPNRRLSPYPADMKKPGNNGIYEMGADPFDASVTDEEGSKGAFAVKIKFLPDYENPDLMYDESSNPINVADMWTDTYVCDYIFREKNPYSFYEDALKTAIFYGVKINAESDKPGLIEWIKNKGYQAYLRKSIKSPDIIKRQRRKGADEKLGTKASTPVITRYTELLTAYVYSRINSVRHPRIIAQWAEYKITNRGKLDLVVASAMTELSDKEGMKIAEAKHEENFELYTSQ